MVTPESMAGVSERWCLWLQLHFFWELTENAQSDTFKAPCCCFENAPNTALTIVCTINVSIDCNWSDVPNPITRENILK